MTDGLPRLGPRTWWVYLAVDTPKTLAELSEESGIVEESVYRHLRKLERAGFVARSQEPGAETLWTQSRELDPATVYRLVGKVERGHLLQPGEPPPERPRRYAHQRPWRRLWPF